METATRSLSAGLTKLWSGRGVKIFTETFLFCDMKELLD